MIKLVNVKKEYNDLENKVIALSDINLEIEEGKITAIVGRSGSGKSTMLNLIGTLDIPTSGDIYFDDINVTKLKNDELLKFRNEKIGYIFQQFYLETSLSVLTNVEIPLMIRGINKEEREKQAFKILEKLDLKGKEKTICSKLSGGEQQRVSIARALIADPKLILADEPTGSLDSSNALTVLNILKDIAKTGKTVVLVTHNMDDAKKYANRIIKLQDGKIIEDINNEI